MRTNQRDLLNVFDQFRETVETAAAAGLSAEDELTQAQFSVLKEVYMEALSTVSDAILEDYRNGAAVEKTSSISFTLTPQEIEKLNSGKGVVINLMERNLFFANEEDIRVSGLEVTEIQLESAAGQGRMSILVNHSGVSLLSRPKISEHGWARA